MVKKLPIKSAKEIAQKYSLKQVILCAWDGKNTHIVTYGDSIEDCSQAAEGGNRIKKALGWPEELCNDKPSRVKKLEEKIEELENIIDGFCEGDADDY